MLSPTFFAQALVSFLEERLGHHQRGLISALYIPCALARAALPEFSFFFFDYSKFARELPTLSSFLPVFFFPFVFSSVLA